MENLEKRLDRLESRLERIEQHLNLAPSAPAEETFAFHTIPPAQESNLPPRQNTATHPLPEAKHDASRSPGGAITRLLGWGGALALVMAAAYLIKLAYDSGWLMLSAPMRVGIAFVCGWALIATGLHLRHKDRHYASLLPAAGVVILFLAIYGAHLHYRLIGSATAASGIILTCGASLWLCRTFASDLYGLFAIAGSYSAPFLLDIPSQPVGRLTLYYSAWSIGFCLYSLLAGRRRYYLLAFYFAVVGFDLLWRQTARQQWQVALIYQFLQLSVFLACTVLFSLRHKRPLDQRAATLHLPILLIFYLLHYSLLHRHLPNLAPWVALAVATAIGFSGQLADRLSKHTSAGGRLILTCFAGLALVHIGYLELTPPLLRPWLALLTLPALLAWTATRHRQLNTDWPLLAAIGMLWLVNFSQVLGKELPTRISGQPILTLLHAVELYAGYALLRNRATVHRLLQGSLIYLGHLAAMAAAWQLLHSSLGVSFAWGLLALTCLGLCLKLHDRVLGHSSLLLFGFSALKVLLHDLAGAAPLVRIGCLLVVGVTFYAGGWLYRYIEKMPPRRP